MGLPVGFSFPPQFSHLVIMENSKLLLWIGGIYNLGFAVFHLFFWRLFRWRQDLAHLMPVNRAVMQILNLCLTFVFLLFAWISIVHSTELLMTGLGKTIMAGIAFFWFLRMIEQILFFGLRNRVSMIFPFLFLAGGLLYLLPLWIGG